MNWNQVEGSWKDMRGRVREKWAKLTDDDLELAAGKKDQLLAKLQQRYGYARDKAERELDRFIEGLAPDKSKQQPTRH